MSLIGKTIIGTCSVCGGNVTVHTNWMCVVPDVPKCESCGARKAAGPVIDMVPSRPSPARQPWTGYGNEDWRTGGSSPRIQSDTVWTTPVSEFGLTWSVARSRATC